MHKMRGLTNALVVALISLVLTIGALSISLVEFSPQAVPTATNNILPSPVPLTATPTFLPTFTPTTGLISSTPSITITPSLTNTNIPPASCTPPFGWSQIVTQPGETLEDIATQYRVSKDDLRSANCLLSDNLVPGKILYVPPVMASTSVTCNQGAAGWAKIYVVRSNDTLYSIATNHYTTVAKLKSVNCRVSDLIIPGELLWVPNVATRTPVYVPLPGNTPTAYAYPTEPLTETALPYTATAIPTDTLDPNISTQ